MPKVNSHLPLVPVVLSGGSGTRLWPMSRQCYPKQFISLIGEQSLFQATLKRLNGIERMQSAIVICNQEHRFMAAEELRQIDAEDARIILEPVGKNTAPAIAIAALEACEQHGDASLLVLPADHLIQDVTKFQDAVRNGYKAVTQGLLVTFGIVPIEPHTGYGYIRQGKPLPIEGSRSPFFTVDAFVEKPDLSTAERYLSMGGYLWNSGMFLFKASTYLRELKRYAADVYEACSAAYSGRSADLEFIRLEPSEFEKSPSISIDYAVMENTPNAAVIPMDAGWSDVGSWHSLWDVESNSDAANVTVGDVLTEDCKGCYLHANHRLVAGIGLQDMVVVETADAVLVARRERAQDVRTIVDRLQSSARREAALHRKVYRPWGAYESIDIADRFLVKRITVNPSHSLSLQMHHHRAEHWVVVKGMARVTCNDKVYMLGENESTYIPFGAKHRLENPGKIPLELIEVQSGGYLGEDDIVRFEDNYGR